MLYYGTADPMAKLKTQKTTASVKAFLAAVEDPERRKDCETVARLMQKVTKAEPAMWGTSIIGFGAHSYRNSAGKEVAWFQTGFSPRKRDLTLYLMGGAKSQPALLKKLGPHKTGGSCLYLKRLADLDVKVLEALIVASVKDVTARTR
jgi:hypothetical protein